MPEEKCDLWLWRSCLVIGEMIKGDRVGEAAEMIMGDPKATRSVIASSQVMIKGDRLNLPSLVK